MRLTIQGVGTRTVSDCFAGRLRQASRELHQEGSSHRLADSLFVQQPDHHQPQQRHRIQVHSEPPEILGGWSIFLPSGHLNSNSSFTYLFLLLFTRLISWARLTKRRPTGLKPSSTSSFWMATRSTSSTSNPTSSCLATFSMKWPAGKFRIRELLLWVLGESFRL